MTRSLSDVVPMQPGGDSSGFSVRRMDLGRLGGAVGLRTSLLALAHFRMSAPTFAPHPHAGIAAVTYLFEDSPGGMHNRDSLGSDFVAQPGELIWSQAGAGLVHDERPAHAGAPVHGLQLFVASARSQRALPPQVLRLTRGEAPRVVQGGCQVRVVVGEHAGSASPLRPPEPFLLLDAQCEGELALTLQPGCDTLVYLLQGRATVHAEDEHRTLAAGEVVAIRPGVAALAHVRSDAHAHLLVVAGPPPD